MNKEEEELLFLSQLYNTWPWYYDREAIIELRGKIINMQHRKLAKIRGQEYIKKSQMKKKKKKSKKRKKEFSPKRIKSHNVT